MCKGKSNFVMIGFFSLFMWYSFLIKCILLSVLNENHNCFSHNSRFRFKTCRAGKCIKSGQKKNQLVENV